MGAPGELPTTAWKRSSKAAATSACFPLRLCPVMAVRAGSTRGPPAPSASRKSRTREASQARRMMSIHEAPGYMAAKPPVASRVSAPG